MANSSCGDQTTKTTVDGWSSEHGENTPQTVECAETNSLGCCTDDENGPKTQEQQKGDESPAISLGYFNIFMYFLCSSMMLILNKLALNRLPFPVAITAAQTISSVLLIELLRILGCISYPNTSWLMLVRWKWVGVVFITPVILNMHAMQFMGVEAIMIFRSATTVMVAISDILILKTKITFRQMIACGIISVGSLLFAVNDMSIPVQGLFWGSLYSFSLVFNTIYIKHVFTQQADVGPWGKTLMNNIVASPLILTVSYAVEDLGRMHELLLKFSSMDFFVIFLSCVGGFGISFSGTCCRQMLSATGFDVLGNCTKYATLAFNAFLLGSNLSAASMAGVLLALSGGVLYSPASSLVCKSTV
jgi:solute carrier family 35 protein